MKKIMFVAGTFLTAVSLLSCEKESPYAISATIDGLPWESNGGVNAYDFDSIFVINAYNSDDQTMITMQFEQFDTPGTYAIDSITSAFGYGTYSGQNVNITHFTYADKPGTYTITTYDPGAQNLKGTFAITAFNNLNDSVVVTDGDFNLYFQ